MDGVPISWATFLWLRACIRYPALDSRRFFIFFFIHGPLYAFTVKQHGLIGSLLIIRAPLPARSVFCSIIPLSEKKNLNKPTAQRDRTPTRTRETHSSRRPESKTAGLLGINNNKPSPNNNPKTPDRRDKYVYAGTR